MLENYFFMHISNQSLTMLQHSGTASANTLKPLVSIRKQGLELTLLKSTSLTAHDYKLLDVLPLKLKLEFNKGVIIHKIVSGYAPSNQKLIQISTDLHAN